MLRSFVNLTVIFLYCKVVYTAAADDNATITTNVITKSIEKTQDAIIAGKGSAAMDSLLFTLSISAFVIVGLLAFIIWKLMEKRDNERKDDIRELKESNQKLIETNMATQDTASRKFAELNEDHGRVYREDMNKIMNALTSISNTMSQMLGSLNAALFNKVGKTGD